MASAAFVADVADCIFIVFSLKACVCAMRDDDLLTHTGSVSTLGVGWGDGKAGREGARGSGTKTHIPLVSPSPSPQSFFRRCVALQ
jgi:hypothetical protein